MDQTASYLDAVARICAETGGGDARRDDQVVDSWLIWLVVLAPAVASVATTLYVLLRNGLEVRHDTQRISQRGSLIASNHIRSAPIVVGRDSRNISRSGQDVVNRVVRETIQNLPTVDEKK